jgi:hypothetical protein
MNYKRLADWQEAETLAKAGEQVYVKRQDTGEWEPLEYTGNAFRYPNSTEWYLAWLNRIGVVPYVATTEAVEITPGEAFERMLKGEPVEWLWGDRCLGEWARYRYENKRGIYVEGQINGATHDWLSRPFRIPAIEPETETETVTIEVPKGAKIVVDGKEVKR